MVMREPRTEAAILETARGGILRRGIAVPHADTAVITNVSSDHFGEYGIHDLAGLADVKLAVAAAVVPAGLLVLNADDAQLRAQAARLAQRFGRCPPLGWFALDADQATLREHRLRGASTCGVRAGHLYLGDGGAEHDLGQVSAMPLSMGGMAAYNVANLAGAALAAVALGIAPATIAAVFARFGADLGDNPGRMMRFDGGRRAGADRLRPQSRRPAWISQSGRSFARRQRPPRIAARPRRQPQGRRHRGVGPRRRRISARPHRRERGRGASAGPRARRDPRASSAPSCCAWDSRTRACPCATAKWKRRATRSNGRVPAMCWLFLCILRAHEPPSSPCSVPSTSAR